MTRRDRLRKLEQRRVHARRRDARRPPGSELASTLRAEARLGRRRARRVNA